jgi:long-chain acyl-CoA synthetase
MLGTDEGVTVSLNLAQILAESAVRHADRTAVVLGDLRISYAQLWHQARQYARVLQQNGVQAGDRVALLLPNTPHFPLAYFATLSLGAVAVPVHALLKAEEIAYVLQDSGAKLLICATPLLAAGAAGAEKVGVPVLTVMPGGDGQAPRIDELAARAEPTAAITPREPSDPAVILYTSGTTGTPKGAVLTHLNVLMNVDVSVIDSFKIDSDDVILGCLPLFHTFGQTCCMNTGFRAGAAIVLMPRFDGAGALELLERERCTVFMGVPTMYFALLEAARARAESPNTSLHSAMSGGSALPLPVLERFKDVFGVDVMEGYGLTETSPVATFNQRNFEPRPGTVGPAIWGVEVEITRAELDDRIELLPAGELGEVIVRGHNVFAGYLNNPEATAATFTDGWFRTGDLGTKDADGYLTIVDRKKEMILRGGFNVYPREVEEALIRHPGVGQVAVIATPDEKYGEEICAVVVRDSAAPEVTAEELKAWAKERVASYKYPRIVYFVDAMPMGPSGKILKRQLVADLRDRSS